MNPSARARKSPYNARLVPLDYPLIAWQDEGMDNIEAAKAAYQEATHELAEAMMSGTDEEVAERYAASVVACLDVAWAMAFKEMAA